MIWSTHTCRWLGGLMLSIVLPAAADNAPPLTHNPFARPPSEVTVVDRGVDSIRDGLDGTIELTATLVGAKYKLANVAGRIIRLGEEVGGYRLIEVHEDHAVFSRAGNRTTVYVKPDLVESDE